MYVEEKNLINFLFISKEILTSAEFISIDAGIRAYANLYSEGIVMIGGQIAKVIDSKNSEYPKDSYIYARFGWQTIAKFNPKKMDGNLQPYILPDFGKFPISLGLGYLGMPGYFFFFLINQYVVMVLAYVYSK